MQRLLFTSTAAAALAVLAACNAPPTVATTTLVDNSVLPPAVRVPAGEQQKLWVTTSGGRITYECRAAADGAPPGWVLVAPQAALKDRDGRVIGSYVGPPATWEASDGSRVIAKPVATAAGVAGGLPLQLFKAASTTGGGVMQGVTYVQRLNTVNGGAPSSACSRTNVGERQQVVFAADYVFYGR